MNKECKKLTIQMLDDYDKDLSKAEINFCLIEEDRINSEIIEHFQEWIKLIDKQNEYRN